MKQIKVKADTAELDNVLSFADAILEELGCSVKAQMQIDIAIEEIFVEDPDITLSAEDRPIGGLGIFMVKKSMDEVSYEYKDGKNRLTIKKSF